MLVIQAGLLAGAVAVNGRGRSPSLFSMMVKLAALPLTIVGVLVVLLTLRLGAVCPTNLMLLLLTVPLTGCVPSFVAK